MLLSYDGRQAPLSPLKSLAALTRNSWNGDGRYLVVLQSSQASASCKGYGYIPVDDYAVHIVNRHHDSRDLAIWCTSGWLTPYPCIARSSLLGV